MMRNSLKELEIPSGRVARGTVRVPGSKSLTQRALIISALARGRSRITGALDSDDSRVLRRALVRLGVRVRTNAAAWHVHGRGGSLGPVRSPLQVENAGTAMRFLTALVSLGSGTYILDGTPRMRRRPIGDLVRALRRLGVRARCLDRQDCPPVEVQGSGILPGGETRLTGSISSQYLSALLMVSPLAERTVSIRLSGRLVSAPYVTLTLGVMRAFGARLRATGLRGRTRQPPAAGAGKSRHSDQTREKQFRIPGRQHYRARHYRVEGDASSATYFLAAAALTGGRVRISNLPSGSLQGDARFINLLRRMGCRVKKGPGGIEACGPPANGRLRGIDTDMSDMPDAVPTLAVVALFAASPTRIRGAAHLRVKESDRLAALAREITRLGGACRETRDGLIIRPGPLRPATVRTYDDHRMAMAFALVGLRIAGVRIQNPSCVRKSFPGYFTRLRSILRPSPAHP